ncbi:uncharacterized protein LOC108108934 [Drosophila eugracilis]|uniref:uncharacterized protein LOC108108934 n=1 Tax=Drosophila eugracilis TaxID=29029 RepID=UPI0007E79E0A|nr:uncharacterized protein LOC108108934 [Drosophila eugracilis]
MKLLFVVLVVFYIVAVTLLGVDGRGGGTTNGVEEPKFVGLFKRSRRNALVNNEGPPPTAKFRQRRQAPPGMPPPPEGLPPPPSFLV